VARLDVRTNSQSHRYQIEIGRGVLRKLGPLARKALQPSTRRVLIISNPVVYTLYGRQAVESLRTGGFDSFHWLMAGGERYKSLRTLEKLLAFLNMNGLERGDAIIALGGGVVGDLAGFAAAIHLRGISFIQVPTTLLAQIDSSVGGKTGVNLSSGKNVVGAFHQPRLVVADLETLTTLPQRELSAGLCETVKQGAVSSQKLFMETMKCLALVKGDKRALVSKKFENLIASQCAFKASIVAGDERESINRYDHRSRKILNFGHTVAHALETLTGYRRFRHGEAVGYGILVAADISNNIGLLDSAESISLREAVHMCGRLPNADDLRAEDILDLIRRDKKSLAGRLKWVLLERIGRARLVDQNEIPHRLLLESLRAGLTRKLRFS
jgi:3-dehydroquinate synthase